ncbi:hypothetical protein LNKW23_38740 [Paralimibaculum aggregatum]|uniref:Uncharacterized protein n=1 Tax=Paralimibaculum aggregatum TaxID=3036245 RepID=A0ABQ6LRH0_9RHOB|nr:hypothetical protein LNKW23_38740 [Limibaculum sp. NKW23]
MLGLDDGERALAGAAAVCREPGFGDLGLGKAVHRCAARRAAPDPDHPAAAGMAAEQRRETLRRGAQRSVRVARRSR